MNIVRHELVRLTQEYSGAWGINHTRRLLQLISIIGEGQSYNADALWVAAHLHDWGGYGEWAQPGVDHALARGKWRRHFERNETIPRTKRSCSWTVSNSITRTTRRAASKFNC